MFRKILVALDLEQRACAEIALQRALQLGGREALYQLFSVLPPLGGSMVASFLPQGYDRPLLKKLQDDLHAFSAPWVTEYSLQHVVSHGSIHEEILSLAQREACDLIVMAAGRKHLGLTAARVLRDASLPVLIAR